MDCCTTDLCNGRPRQGGLHRAGAGGGPGLQALLLLLTLALALQ